MLSERIINTDMSTNTSNSHRTFHCFAYICMYCVCGIILLRLLPYYYLSILIVSIVFHSPEIEMIAQCKMCLFCFYVVKC